MGVFTSLCRVSVLTAVVLSVGCGGLTYQRLDPGGEVIQQNITYSPLTTATQPATVSRTSGLPAVITAALTTRTVSLTTSGQNCVSEQIPGGFVPGGTTYSFSFLANSGAPANCSETVTITVDGDAVAFYLVVP